MPQCFAALNSSNRCDFIIMWDAFKSNLNESTTILSRDGLPASPLSTSRVQISKVSTHYEFNISLIPLQSNRI